MSHVRRGFAVAIAAVTLSSAVSAQEVPPETLAVLGLGAMQVIHDDPAYLWSEDHRPPGWVPYDARPFEPGVQSLTPPTRTYVNRRLTTPYY